jgi:hypothetical protein
MKNPFSSKKADSRSLMTNARLDVLIRELSDKVEGQLGYWQFTIAQRDLLVVTDERHNRMRIMTPVAAQDQLDKDELLRLLSANYDRALDAKYALSQDTLWSVFTHPLKELTDEQFIGCVGQVATLADNFGGSYASSGLFFGGG